MSTRRPTVGVKVRGACPAGHVTEAMSDPGRTTWEGPCAQPGCGLRVAKARRVPRDRLPDGEPASPDPTATEPPGDHVVKDVTGDAPYGQAPADRLDGAGDAPDIGERPTEHVELDPDRPGPAVQRRPDVVEPAAPAQRPRRPGLRQRAARAAGHTRAWSDSADLPGGFE